MRIVAYTYTDLLIEESPGIEIWGWEIDRVYQDLGQRYELDRLLQDLRLEPCDYLLVRRLDELGESVRDVREVLLKLQELNVELVTTETEIAPQLNLLQLIDKIQTDLVSRRMRQGHARNRLHSLPPPGKAPYGYRRGKDKYTIDKSAAPVVKDFFDRFTIYGSLRGAVRYLEKKYNKKIAASTGLRWLTNPVYRGDIAYLKGEVISDTHAAILSRDEAAQIDRLLRRNRQMPPRTASAPRSLAGLVNCQQCRQTMTVTSVSAPRRVEKYLYLRPTGCTRQPQCKSIRYERVLNATIDRICTDLPIAVNQLGMPNTDGFKAKISQDIIDKQQTIANLPELIDSGILDRETVELRTYKLKTEISQLQSRLAAFPPVNLQSLAQAVSIPQFWLDLSESERRFYFREFIKSIDIDPQSSNLDLQLRFIF
ncbi:recombinase family protein [Chamaesiphon minutus]|uniref:Site-specific recombinase, DNA invertase Pin n=1 Tax=Chamaesiphon minutus (strain ATCC 27169 / PCC 6605) TaxID=1173020 RepID=K9UG96_CHAP6|nr:recombinase family protein [Chamaesiphon minutus]AFY93815.1 site-specific recombinase, DNA invertase Pin [Chamaesiphon minutus PCC 6605]